MQESSLSGKRVVITGGSSGIGLACAKAVVARGGQAVIAARKAENLRKAAEALGPSTQTYVLDVGREDEVRRFFEQVGPFDHLLTPAAGNVVGAVREMDIQVAREFFEAKFWGQYMCARFASAYVRPGGSITLFSGAGARKVFPGFALVGTSEGAIEVLTKYLAAELAPIRVNAVVPGVIDTPLTATIPHWEAMKGAIASALPVKRVGQAEDIAHACVFLMENGFTSGAILDVNGGNEVI